MTKIKRTDNEDFKLLLENIRLGHNRETIFNQLKPLINKQLEPDKLTILCATNEKCSYYNNMAYDQLEGEEKIFNYFEKTKDKNNKEFKHSIKLKIGSFVMLNRNLDLNQGLINGFCGYVTSFGEDGSIIIDNKFKLGYVTANFGKILYVPLIYAWSSTIHKAQGLTIKHNLIIDCEDLYLIMLFMWQSVEPPILIK